MNHPYATIMIGNTHTSGLGWSAEGVAGDYESWRTADGLAAHREATPDFYDPFKKLVQPGATLILASVVPAYQELLRAGLIELGFTVKDFRTDLKPQIDIAPQPPERVGDDRIAGALGALVIYPSAPAVVVDAGTALTVNMVKPPHGGMLARFEGGVIIPGQQAMLSALAGHTAQLPQIEAHTSFEAAHYVGRSTDEAMRLGAWHAYSAGAVFAAIRQAGALGASARVLLTGGGARALQPAFKQLPSKYSVELQPQLVHRGIFSAFQDARS